MINTYNLFTTQVTHGVLPLQPIVHKKILSYVEENYKEEDTVSCQKGFQFHKNFDGKKELDRMIQKTFKQMFDVNLYYGWLNVLGNNSYNKPHSHKGDYVVLSGVYYLSNTNNNITFLKENQTFSIEPKLFDYLIFPYDLTHYVLPEKRNEKRICYAFNLKI
tara:strand:- start:730 stop:1215 length:486 start_codon:yes stop_codon:yes gene_type:complete